MPLSRQPLASEGLNLHYICADSASLDLTSTQPADERPIGELLGARLTYATPQQYHSARAANALLAGEGPEQANPFQASEHGGDGQMESHDVPGPPPESPPRAMHCNDAPAANSSQQSLRAEDVQASRSAADGSQGGDVNRRPTDSQQQPAPTFQVCCRPQILRVALTACPLQESCSPSC